MKLKHEWTPQQEKIILAAKKQLKREPFEIQLDITVAVQTVLERKNIPFYEAWDDITADLKGNHCFSEPYWYIIFLQCCVSVLTKQKNLQQQLSVIPEAINDFLEHLPHLKTPTFLPERLPDKQLASAAENGDLPQIIMLYDMAQNPGQKMKNIYHILLNKGHYEQAIFLHERYGGLDQIDHHILQEHFLFIKNCHCEKKFFDKFFWQNIFPKCPDIWSVAHSYCILDKVLETAFEYEVIPGGTVLKRNYRKSHYSPVIYYKLPLITFLHLVDELKEELEICDPWKISYYSIAKYMKSILEAARIYSAWENERKDDNHGSAQ